MLIHRESTDPIDLCPGSLQLKQIFENLNIVREDVCNQLKTRLVNSISKDGPQRGRGTGSATSGSPSCQALLHREELSMNFAVPWWLV